MKTNRRSVLTILTAGLTGLVPLRQSLPQEGQSINSAERLGEQNVVSLEDQLLNGLRTVTPAQRQFVKKVSMYVRMGKLPRAMINLVYDWALQRNPKVPYPYFEFAMKVLSRRRGVLL